MSAPSPESPSLDGGDREGPTGPTGSGSASTSHEEVASGWRPAARELRWPFLAWLAQYYVVSRVLLVASAYVNGRLSASTWTRAVSPLPMFFDPEGRVSWGAGDYVTIAVQGYNGEDAKYPFFPLLSLLERWLANVLGNVATAGVFVTTVCSLGTVLLFWRWMAMRGIPRRERKVATLLLLLYPYAFLFAGVPYAEALLLFFVMLAFVLVEADHPVLAGLAAAAATATRPNSAPIIIALVAFVLARAQVFELRTPADPERRWRDRLPAVHLDRLRPAHLGVLLSLAGIGAYSLWLNHVTGDPLRFLHAESNYGHRPITEISEWTKSYFFTNPGGYIFNWVEATNEVLSLVILVAVIATIPSLTRRFGVAYGIFVVGVTAISWVHPHGIAPAGRYLMPAIPFFIAVAARWLADRRRVLWPLLISSGLIMLVLTTQYARGSAIWGEW